VGEEPETVETVAEPYLVREGMLGRTPRGRIATAAAWEHLGLVMPPTVAAAMPEDLFSVYPEDPVPGIERDAGSETEWSRNEG
jgi:Holliday junction DNA helicase RuvB